VAGSGPVGALLAGRATVYLPPRSRKEAPCITTIPASPRHWPTRRPRPRAPRFIVSTQTALRPRSSDRRRRRPRRRVLRTARRDACASAPVRSERQRRLRSRRSGRRRARNAVSNTADGREPAATIPSRDNSSTPPASMRAARSSTTCWSTPHAAAASRRHRKAPAWSQVLDAPAPDCSRETRASRHFAIARAGTVRWARAASPYGTSTVTTRVAPRLYACED
jgi:hypothetical protein